MGTVQAVATVRWAERQPGTSKGGFGTGPKTIDFGPDGPDGATSLPRPESQTGLYGVKSVDVRVVACHAEHDQRRMDGLNLVEHVLAASRRTR